MQCENTTKSAARASGANVASDHGGLNRYMNSADDNAQRYFYAAPPEVIVTRPEVELLRERAQRLETFRQLVAAGPCGGEEWERWGQRVTALALSLA